MLARLWHHSFVGGNDEQSQVDPARSHHHAAHEILVTGHVDHADGANSLENEWRKPEIDGDAPPLFLGKPIGIDSGKRFDELCLAVINVSGGTDDHAALHRSCSHTSNARRGRSSGMCASRNSRKSRWWERPSASERETASSPASQRDIAER